MASDAVFPDLDGLAWDMSAAPRYNTTVQSSLSQREVRVSYTPAPVYDVKLSYEFLRSGRTGPDLTALRIDLETLQDFYKARRGKFESFLFRHWYDNQLTGEQIGTGDGTTKTFNLGRTRDGVFEPLWWLDTATSGAAIFDDLMWSLGDDSALMWATGDSSASMWGSGAFSAGAGEYTISNGQVTFTTAPAVGQPVRMTCPFYYRARFDQDSLPFVNLLEGYWKADVALVATLGDQL